MPKQRPFVNLLSVIGTEGLAGGQLFPLSLLVFAHRKSSSDTAAGWQVATEWIPIIIPPLHLGSISPGLYWETVSLCAQTASLRLFYSDARREILRMNVFYKWSNNMFQILLTSFFIEKGTYTRPFRCAVSFIFLHVILSQIYDTFLIFLQEKKLGWTKTNQ